MDVIRNPAFENNICKEGKVLEMRDLYYENQGTNTFLVYEFKDGDQIDSMSLGMLTNNRIHGLTQTIFTQMDNRKFIKYNVSAKVSVAQFFSGVVNKKRLLGVFKGIVNAMLAAEDYMLDPTSILLDLNHIFTDVSTCETDLICIPINDSRFEVIDLGSFFRNIMFSTQFDQTENCDHVAKLINYLNGTPLFSLSDFLKVIEEIEGQKPQPVVKKVTADGSATTVTTKQDQLVVKQVQPPQAQKVNIPPANAGCGMAVPPVQPKVEPAAPTSPEITFLYLMQHYNKENAAAYKAQKEAKKKAAAAAKGQPATTQPVQKKAPVNSTPPTGFGFAVPGASAPNPGFAIPGQPAMPPQPVGENRTTVPPAPHPQVLVASQPQNHSVNQPIQSVQKQPVTLQPEQPVYTPPVPAMQGQSMNFGETTVLGGGKIGETTVLNGCMQPALKPLPHLIRKKNNERIELNKPVFRIGKEKSYVDYFISDNTAVSRSHANIITHEGQYYIVDTNSTNHTFVNATMLQSNVEVELKHGDKIRLGNEDFEFKLY